MTATRYAAAIFALVVSVLSFWLLVMSVLGVTDDFARGSSDASPGIERNDFSDGLGPMRMMRRRMDTLESEAASRALLQLSAKGTE